MTIKLVFNKVKQVFDFGNNIQEVINYNPNFNKVILPKINSKIKNDILTDKDIDNILTKYYNTIYYYIFQVAILTGMRIGEILALTWDKIDFDNNLIYIDRTVNNFNMLTSPKNISSIRKIPISSKLKSTLLELKTFPQKKINMTLKNGEITYSDNNDLDFLFRNSEGGCLTYVSVRYKIKKESFHCHQFRHYFATKLINSGVPVPEVSKLLGHAQISTTMNMYVGASKHVDMQNTLNQIF